MCTKSAARLGSWSTLSAQAKFKQEVFALDPAKVAQAGSQCFDAARQSRRRPEAKVSDASDRCRLLRACHERPPCRSTADERDEVPSPHGPPSGRGPHPTISLASTGSVCAAQQYWLGNVAVGVRSCRGALRRPCLLYPQKLPPLSPTGAAAKGRFCCRSRLKAVLLSDSVAVMRFATGAEHDGAAQARAGAAFLFVPP